MYKWPFMVDRRQCLTNINPYARQLLALCTSGWSVECIGRPWNMTLFPAHRSFFVTDADSTDWAWPVANDCFSVVRNIDLFERELSRYGYDVICLQYRNIRYDAMHPAIIIFTAINVLTLLVGCHETPIKCRTLSSTSRLFRKYVITTVPKG